MSTHKANPGASPSDLYFLIASDERYGAPVMKIAERRAALGRGPVYLYYFRWETPLEGGRYKAPHTVEIPFVFHNLEASPWTRGVAGAMPLADQVSDAWLAFARSGDPNTPRLAALAGVRCAAPRDDGVRRDERRRRRPAARAAHRDVRGEGPRDLSADRWRRRTLLHSGTLIAGASLRAGRAEPRAKRSAA